MEQMIEDILSKEQIDGTSLTENPDVQYRRKRIISKPSKWKRPNKVKEMLNYCKFKVGEIDTCSKVPASVYNVLSNYKRGRLDLIGSGYLEAINTYKDLIDRAIKIDGNTLRRKENKVNTHNKHNNEVSSDASQRLIDWLYNIHSNTLLISPRNNTYTMHFTTFKNGKGDGYLPKYITEVLSTPLGRKILENYHHSNGRLVRNTIDASDALEFFKYIKKNGPLDNAVLTKDREFRTNGITGNVNALIEPMQDDGTKRALEILEDKRQKRKEQKAQEVKEDVPNLLTIEFTIDSSISMDKVAQALKSIGAKEFLINC